MIRIQLYIPFFITSPLFFISSCTQPVKEATEISSGLVLEKLKVEEIRILKDSIAVFNIVPAGNPKIIPAGKPKISLGQTHMFPSGTPSVVKAGIPQKIIPGKNGVKLPETTPVEIRKISCINRPAQEAMNPGSITGMNTLMKYLDIEQGMASGYILTMYQDKKGNIWLGTSGEGILKYDGKKFIQYSAINGLPNAFVRCILEDKDGNFWFGTDGGLVKYDGVDFYWIIDDGVDSKNEGRIDIRSLVFDKTGNLWIGTAKYGAFKFDGKSFTHFSQDYTIGPYVSGIIKDRNDDLWFASNGNGIINYNGKAFLRYTQTEGLISNSVNCIAEDDAGNLWFGTYSGVSKYDKTSFTNISAKEGLCNNNVNCILQDSNKNIWFGTDDGGACKYDGKSFTHFNIKEGFRSNLIRCIMQDKTSNIYFGTYGGGVMILNENSFVTYGRETALNISPVLSMNEDNEGNIWFGGFDGAIKMYDGNRFYSYSASEGFNSKHIHSIIKDKKGNMWFGSESHGLYKFDGKIFSLYTEKEGMGQARILGLYEDKKGNIWIGTVQSGISKFDGKTFTNIQPRKIHGGEGFWAILEDRKGNMWFGSHNNMLLKYDGNTFFAYYPGEVIYSLLEDADGNIWIGNGGTGLIKFDGKAFYRVSTKDGATISQIKSMEQDKNENLWIGTEKGLKYFINPSGKPGTDSKIISYSLKDGLPGEAFQQKASFIDSKERMWLGTDKGAIILDTKTIDFDTAAPVVRLTEININGRVVDFHHLDSSLRDTSLPANFKNITYTHAEKFYNYPLNPKIPFKLNHFTFNFSVSEPEISKSVLYKYMLEGLDDKWSEPTTKSSVDFRNIPYGNYTFKVKAMGNAQKWSSAFEYPFKIKRPWWHSWYFRSFAFISFLAGVHFLYQYRTRSLQQRQVFLQHTVNERTEQLRELLNEKEALLKEIHHRVKNNLEVISSLLMLQTNNITDEKAKAALAEGQSRVQSIALIHHKLYRTDDMASVEMKGFATDLFKQVADVYKKPGDTIKFEISGNEMTVDTDRAVPLGLILNELLTNAFKYAMQPGRENIISLHLSELVRENETHYKLIFHDNGKGMPADFNMQQTTSLGMKVIHLLTKQLVGSLNNYNDGGAVFEIEFSKQKFSTR